MNRRDLETEVADYAADLAEIEGILDDESLTAEERLEAIANVISDGGDESSEDEAD